MITEHKQDLYNVLNLIFLRIVSRVIPLILQGYVLQKVGLLSFGQLGYAMSIAYCFSYIIEYGFRYSVPEKIIAIVDQEDKKKYTGKLLISVLSLQVLLALSCYIIYVILIHCIDSIGAISQKLWFFYLVSISSGIVPYGVFQGLNKLHWLSIINPICKIIFYLAIPIFIHGESDVERYPMLLAIVDWLRLLVFFFIIYFILKVPLYRPSYKLMIEQMRCGCAGFLSSFYRLFYSQLPSIFLGLYTNAVTVGYYKIGDRLAQLTKDILEPILQGLYPRASQCFSQNIENGKKYVKKIILLTIIPLSCLGILSYIFSENFILLFSGEMIPEANSILRIHSFLPTIFTLSNIIGLFVLACIGKDKIYSYILAISAVLATTLHFKLVYKYNAIGAAMAILYGETFTLICVLLCAWFSIRRMNN